MSEGKDFMETGLLGCCLTNCGIVDEIEKATGGLNPFGKTEHWLVFDAMQAIRRRNESFDYVLLAKQLQESGTLEDAGGFSFVAELFDPKQSTEEWRRYVKDVVETWRRREILIAAEEVKKACAAGDWDAIEAKARELSESSSKRLGPLDLLKACRLDPTKPPKESPPLFLVNGVGIATACNIQVISGQAKAGKSAFLEAMIAAAMAPTGERDTLGIEARRENGVILHFDTEQSPFDHWRLLDKARRRSGLAQLPDWVKSYSCAGKSPDELQAMLRAALDNEPKVFAVLLDGVADFIADPNDTEASFKLVRELHYMAIANSCCIFSVLHLNPSADGKAKTRGHLGSQLERKAETTLQIDASNGVSTVWTAKSRGAPIFKNEGARFSWCSRAEMHVSRGSEAEERLAESMETLTQLAEDAFTASASFRYCDLVDKIKGLEAVSASTAKRRVREMEEAGVIEKTQFQGRYIRSAEAVGSRVQTGFKEVS